MYNPKQHTFIGVKALENLSQILAGLNQESILVVHGKNSFEKSGAKELLQPYLKNNRVAFFSDFTENPILSDVEKLITVIKSVNPKLIMAVGGGSALDIAKTARALTYSTIALVDAVQSNQIPTHFPCPLLAIPTTAGTGSEATHFSVVYHNKKKYSLASAAMLPDYAIVDPAFSLNLPAYLRACTAMDALCQAIESFWSVNATDESKYYAQKAILLIKENIRVAIDADAIVELQAKAYLCEAAYYSGCAINITKTTAPHALSYWLTMEYNIPHGHAVALNIGRFLWAHGTIEHDSQLNGNLSYDKHMYSMQQLYSLLGCSDGLTAYQWIKQLMKDLGLKTEWHEFNLESNTVIIELIREVNLERMQNNPVRFKAHNLETILGKAI